MTRIVLLSVFGLLALRPEVMALTIEGVSLPEQKTVSGQSLSLNGAGLRTVTLAFIPIKAYVASFYAPAPLRTAQAVMASQGPLQFNFAFLRAVSQGQVTDAWNAQFEQSVTRSYPGLASDQAKFVAMFGPLGKGGVETVEMEGDSTRVYDSGKLKGTIQGADFQKAFLTLWFGSNPVMPSLKSSLLGN